MKLYDMDEQEWRDGDFDRGDHWRANKVYVCRICHTKTNRWIMGGWPGMGPRLLCPGDRYSEHDELEKVLEKSNSLEDQINEYTTISKETSAVDKKETKKMLRYLQTQKQLLDVKISNLRKKFEGKCDGVEGHPLKSEEFYPGSRCAGVKTPLP